MEQKPSFGLIKCGEGKFINEFVRVSLYMNTLGYFLTVEKEDVARYDPHEGESYMLQANGTRLDIKVDGAFIPIAGIMGAIRRRQPEDLEANVFCMYALLKSAAFRTPPIDVQNQAFGDTFAVVLNPEEFLRRVDAAGVPQGQHVRKELVEYVG